ncbi:MAG: VIT domain-containing protein [Planctomycetota bacterium]
MTGKTGFAPRVAAVVLATLALTACSQGLHMATDVSRAEMESLARLDADEVWVIERDSTLENEESAFESESDVPGQGELRVVRRGEEPTEGEVVHVPLEHTDVVARVSGFVSSVEVTQTFLNPYDTKIEAVYVFPLPTDAAVTDFLLTIGERRIRGLIREKEEAERIYEQAKHAGHVAALLTQQRPNVFDQRVANIEPGKRIDVRISYFNTVAYENGTYEFVFPMVVGPRFNPPGRESGRRQLRNPSYLWPRQRSGHDIAIALEVDAGLPVTSFTSPSHAIRGEDLGENRYRVKLAPNDRVPNRDFVVRWTTPSEKLEGAFLAHAPESGDGTFALLLQPPKDDANLPRMPREMVFVVDTSGSMSGAPLDKAKDAMRRCLRGLDPSDTFQVIRFSNDASALGDAPVPATRANVRRGLEYVDDLGADGGTMMDRGIRAALQFPQDERRLRIVSFMTDGYIGNEVEIFELVERYRGRARIFSFGVGDSVNRYLLEGLARHGRGAVAFVGLSDSAAREVDRFYERSARPALTDVHLDVKGASISDVYPRRLPDLYAGRPVLVTGRLRGSGEITVHLTGRRGDGRATWRLTARVDPESNRPELARIWARRKIAHLSELEVTRPSAELRDEITRVSLSNSVQCRYTAFLAVDTLVVTEGREGVTVPVPVPVPQGVKYETAVGTSGN